MHHPTDSITHTTAFGKPVVEHWLEREIAQWVHHEGLIPRPIAPWANALTTKLYMVIKLGMEINQLLWSNGWNKKCLIGSTMKDWSHDPSYEEQTLLPRSYISLPCTQGVQLALSNYSISVLQNLPIRRLRCVGQLTDKGVGRCQNCKGWYSKSRRVYYVL